jgi:hypothetical protein
VSARRETRKRRAEWILAKIESVRMLIEHTAEFVPKATPKQYSRELIDLIFVQPYRRIENLVDAGIAKTADRIHLSTQARGDRNSSGNADRLEQAVPEFKVPEAACARAEQLQTVCLSLIGYGAANDILRLSADACSPGWSGRRRVGVGHSRAEHHVGATAESGMSQSRHSRRMVPMTRSPSDSVAVSSARAGRSREQRHRARQRRCCHGHGSDDSIGCQPQAPRVTAGGSKRPSDGPSHSNESAAGCDAPSPPTHTGVGRYSSR